MFSDEQLKQRISFDITKIGKVLVQNTIIPGFKPVFVFKQSENSYALIQDQHLHPKVLAKGPLTNVIRDTFRACGFIQTDSSSQFNIQWSCPRSLDYIRRLSDCQIFNHIPGQYCLTHKAELALTIGEKIQQFGKEFEFVPKSYSIPNQLQSLKTEMDQNKGYYIQKQSTAARGEGIKLIQSFRQVSEVASVVQRYISNPLLINKRKFDFRVYVVVTSIEPLIVYKYKLGFARFASYDYEGPNQKNFRAKKIHLTNYSVNKVEDENAKRLLSEVLNYIEGNKSSLLPQKLIEQIEKQCSVSAFIEGQIDEIIAKTFIAGQDLMKHQCSYSGVLTCVPIKVFGYYGFDIILDDQLQAKLLEVNLQPATATGTQLDKVVKYNFIADMLTLIGLPANTTQKGYQRPKLSAKQLTFTRPSTASSANSGRYSTNEMLKLFQIYDEQGRIGQFQRLLPDSRYLKYNLGQTDRKTAYFIENQSIKELETMWAKYNVF